MARRQPQVPAATDDQVRTLLDRYRCPVPFHAVRTRFLGNIASPVVSVVPLEAVKALWGGELPVFDSLDAVNELLAVLVMGLWNRLAGHQQRSVPFRLVRVDATATRECLARIALIRREEMDGFVDRLFGKEERLDLPERAHRALTELSTARAMWEGIHELTSDPTKPATADDITTTLRHVKELTTLCEHEIHDAVLACTRARRQMLRSVPSAKPTLH